MVEAEQLLDEAKIFYYLTQFNCMFHLLNFQNQLYFPSVLALYVVAILFFSCDNVINFLKCETTKDILSYFRKPVKNHKTGRMFF